LDEGGFAAVIGAFDDDEFSWHGFGMLRFRMI
jgi:hypothetical protein